MKTQFGNPEQWFHYVLLTAPKYATLFTVIEGEHKMVAMCPIERWLAIKQAVMHSFNERVKASGGERGKWGQPSEGTRLERLLGRELCLLLIAISRNNPVFDDPAPALAYWLALRPEERWWLVQQVENCEPGRGWAVALPTIFYNLPPKPE